MRIVTWNVNSIRQRTEHLLRYMKESAADVVCLQELKCTDEAFPRLEVEAAGYNVATLGQKAYNGVAILSKRPLENVVRGLPDGKTGGLFDAAARYIEATVPGDTGMVRIASIYFPNGNPAGTDKYGFKLAFMERLTAHARALLELEEPLVLAGDYNVIPDARDVYDPSSWLGDALFLPATRGKFQALINLGFTDALRATSDDAGLYTFWDYQAGAWQKNNGIRIDHLLLSPEATDRLQAVRIDKYTRGEDKPSDHVPVWVDIEV